jgi:DNA repair photolyase
MFEPKAPTVSSRFAAMKELAENRIITGTVFMPIPPSYTMMMRTSRLSLRKLGNVVGSMF